MSGNGAMNNLEQHTCDLYSYVCLALTWSCLTLAVNCVVVHCKARKMDQKVCQTSHALYLLAAVHTLANVKQHRARAETQVYLRS